MDVVFAKDISSNVFDACVRNALSKQRWSQDPSHTFDSDFGPTLVFDRSPVLNFAPGLAFDSDPDPVLDSDFCPAFNSDSATNHNSDLNDRNCWGLVSL
ncbi:hypothetical protein EVAR_89564_1 [Eumeta japonica]|uniref:Uncharacterized protein n=1 Tax=Eumeta variegata TaxID=151549 RepID=A0A4C1YN71_EUMVA|nr:hypothetical protein EVAR_89564_1 [Eumeta japonica]